MGRLIEGVWDCAYCDSKKIRGSIRECPVCGRQRDTNVKFYLDNPNNYVDDKTAKTINRNPDWLCSYCDGLNSDDVHKCPTCGASREESEKNYFEHRAEVEARRKAEEEKYNKKYTEPVKTYDDYSERSYDKEESEEYWGASSDYSYDKVNKTNSEAPRSSYKPSNSKKSNLPWNKILTAGIGVILALAMIFGMIWLFTPKTHDVTVMDFSWERSINIEEYVTVERSDWSLPPDGRLLHKEYEIKTYVSVIDHYETKTRTYTEQVLDHYETYVSGHRDLGNGYFEEITSQRPVYRTETRTETYEEPVYRQDPVFDWKYYYEIDIWQHAFYSKSSGNDKEPYWKEVELKELQRENGRSEQYNILTINEKGKEKTYHFDFDVWNSLEKGQKIKIKTHIGGKAELIIDDQSIMVEE